MSAPSSRLNLDYAAAEAAKNLTKVLLEDHKCKPRGRGDKERPIVKAADVDNLVTKSLGVVAESGLFACGLFLLSRSGNKVRWSDLKAEEVVACRTLHALIGLAQAAPWKGVQPEWHEPPLDCERLNERKQPILQHLVGISSVDLPRLLLIRQMWEQTLVYARYMARSLREKE